MNPALSFGEAEREAIGRILRDQPMSGDGALLLQALEAVRDHVEPVLQEGCALQAEYGRRKFAHDLIAIGNEEFERVSTPRSDGTSPGAGRRLGSSGLFEPNVFERGGYSILRRSRRHGPTADAGDAGPGYGRSGEPGET